MKKNLNEFVLSTDRWANRAVSPLDFKSKADQRKPTVIVHPGWGKRPEMFKKLLFALADEGVRPIGVDTRFGYSDRLDGKGYRLGASVTRLARQSYCASDANRYFHPQSAWENRYRLRRPTGLAALCVSLGIEEARMFGHSEGGRIVTTLTAESDVVKVTKLVVANAAGTGDMSNGARRMLRSNTHDNYVMDGTVEVTRGLLSAAESMAYALTHGRRFLREKRVIQSANIWPLLDRVAADGVDVTVFHARGDQLIEFADSAEAASTRPHINFVPTEGSHSNVYTDAITEMLVPHLT